MAGKERHSAELSARKQGAGPTSSARAQLAAIAAGVSTRMHHYGIKSQPLGQKPPAKEEERPKG